MSKNIKSNKNIDYSQLTNEEPMKNDKIKIIKKNKYSEEIKGKIKKIFDFKLGTRLLENFYLILDTKEDNYRNLFILMIFILWIEYLLNGLLVL